MDNIEALPCVMRFIYSSARRESVEPSKPNKPPVGLNLIQFVFYALKMRFNRLREICFQSTTVPIHNIYPHSAAYLFGHSDHHPSRGNQNPAK